MQASVLVTGSDGYLGRRIVRELLKGGYERLLLSVRAADRQEFDAKCRDLRTWLGDGGKPGIEFIAADLTVNAPFAGVDPARIDYIVHTAANTRLNVDHATAESVNVQGTRRVLEFARRCDHLRSLAFLSSVYASGLCPGSIPETILAQPPGFANDYEASKFRAEALLANEYADLPYCIFRTVTVVADDATGTVGQFNAIHNSLKLFRYGLLSLIPGLAEVPVHFVDGKLVAATIAEILPESGKREVFNVCYPPGASLTLQQFIDIAYESFNEDLAFRRAKVLKPLLCDMESFTVLQKGVGQFSGPLVGQAVESIAPFVHQLFIHKHIEVSRLVGALAQYTTPDSVVLLRRTCRYLMATRWGAQSAAS